MAGWERGLVLAATLGVLVVNAVAAVAGLHGATTGQVAARYALPFTPAGYVFSIWSLIYVGLVAFSVFQAAGAGARSARVAAIRPAYVFTCLANASWLWFWHHAAPAIALAVMVLLLAALLAMRGALAGSPAGSPRETWCVDLPVRLYLAWIAIATLANLGVVAAYPPWPRLAADPLYASLLLIGATAALAFFAHARWRDPLFAGVIAWAAGGVALKAGQPPLVAVPAMLLAALAALAAIDLLLAPAGAKPPQSTTG